MDGKKIRLAAGALAVSAVALVGIATHEGYRGEAYKETVGIPTIAAKLQKNQPDGQPQRKGAEESGHPPGTAAESLLRQGAKFGHGGTSPQHCM